MDDEAAEFYEDLRNHGVAEESINTMKADKVGSDWFVLYIYVGRLRKCSKPVAYITP
jgi:hypothetical protein